MGKTRDIFKKIRDTKGTFHAKVSKIQGRSGMDLIEAEDIKKGGKNTQSQLSRPVMSHSLRPHESKHAKPPRPS